MWDTAGQVMGSLREAKVIVQKRKKYGQLKQNCAPFSQKITINTVQCIQNNTLQLLLFSSTIQTSQISGSQLGCNWLIKFVYKLENDVALNMQVFLQKSVSVGVITKKPNLFSMEDLVQFDKVKNLFEVPNEVNFEDIL